ncbi:hypothetical protein PVK06_030041 [Gossypium arboreum]|uniref:Reverse transcriptase n=1 Tax=Gossypium arboreum TaxID=29729 RepID=A0ABR0NM86_GOSAR|nr:hypothetical protein PVK06_030041 [Gossypium arboreum]
MKIICWNVRGLGNLRTVRRLWFSLKQHNPKMVFFMETKIDDKHMEKIRRRCGFVNGIDVGANDSQGGICLAWRKEITVSLKAFSKNHIDVLIEESNVSGEWRFIGFYGLPYVSNQSASWNLLRMLGEEQRYSWLVSDNGTSYKRSPRFKFEARWILEELIEREIKKSWESSNGSISEKLESLQVSLTRWVSSIKKGRDGLKKKLTKELGILMESEKDDDIMEKLIHTRTRLNIEINKDEMYWKQRARANWLQLGDKNLAFFINMPQLIE